MFYNSEFVGVSTKILYYYRIVPTSITGIGFTLKSLDRLQFLEERVEYFRERNETELFSLWNLHCVKSYKEYLINLKKYYPHELELRKKLWREYKSRLSQVLRDTNISVVEKGVVIVGFYFPRTMIILGKIL